ncbi:hypothetical protein C8J57DRAFT_1284841 [Mycena rebaudengoi]|nr:hypothetical protein C8J57DRAFT_1284841 [Mycena rebaudengoi]
MSSYEIQAYIRVASLAVAFHDYLQTIPFEVRLCREQLRGRLTLSFILFFLIRYTSIVVLTVSNIGFFYGGFTDRSCAHYILVPAAFKVAQTMVSQAILGVRAYNLSRKSAPVGVMLVSAYIISCTFEWVTTMYRREPQRDPKYVRNCLSRSPQSVLGGWIHYAVVIIYDFIATLVCIIFLLKLKSSGTSSVMAKVVKMMIVDGLWYFLALAAVNAVNMGFYKSQPYQQTSAASVAYCLTWIMSQKLLIHLHDASLQLRNESIAAAVTITQEITSARDVNRALRSQFESKGGGLGLQLTVPDFEIDSVRSGPAHRDDMPDVHVRIERTVRMERLPRVYELEDYSRQGRSSQSKRLNY